MKIYDEDDQTVYIFYRYKKMYAWTTKKSDRDFFIEQRNKSIFRCKKRVMPPIVFRSFMAKYKKCQIIDIPLESDGETYLIRGTYDEDEKFSAECERLLDEFELLDIFFSNIKLKENLPEKYLEAINALLYNFCHIVHGQNEFNVNSLSIFFNLFKGTFP